MGRVPKSPNATGVAMLTSSRAGSFRRFFFSSSELELNYFIKPALSEVSADTITVNPGLTLCAQVAPGLCLAVSGLINPKEHQRITT